MTAERVIAEMGCRAILADEVGLGKTIETGIVLKELLARHKLPSVLVIVPKALEGQWQHELNEKFDLVFHRFADTSPTRVSDSSVNASLITGHSSLSREASFRLLNARTWDLVIVDEAHRFGNSRSNMSRHLERLRKSRVLLLTATPMQNSLSELFRLIHLARPDIFPRGDEWRNYAMDEHGRTLRGSKVGELKGILSQVMCRTRRQDAGIDLPNRLVVSRSLEPTETERGLIDGTNQLFSTLASTTSASIGMGLAKIALMQSLSSHPAALAESPATRGEIRSG
jgi:SNF2 family DNA or RNA helicase